MSLEEIGALYSNRQAFEDTCRGNLYCPNCKTPQLVYCNDKPHYLRTFPNQVHNDNCDYFYPGLDRDTLNRVKGYSSNIKTFETQLERLLRSLMNNQQTSKSESHVYSFAASDEKKKAPNTANTCKLHIPDRKLSSPLRDTDFGFVKNYYGEVVIGWYEDSIKWDIYRYLRIYYPENSETQICTLKIYYPIPKPLEMLLSNEVIGVKCKIAFTAIFEKGKRYNTGELLSPELIHID